VGIRLIALAAASGLALGLAPASAQGPQGYLPPGAIDAARVVGPPPAAGTPAEAADVAAYRAAAAGVGNERWAQAIADDDVRIPAALKRYACALDAELDPAAAPATVRLLARSLVDADAVAQGAKQAYRRPRPFAADDPAAPVCLNIPPERRAASSFTYPSGHATLGAVWGLVLTEAAPQRADALAERTRSFVESRLVCRVHYASDLAAGQRLGAVIFARLQASPEYAADVAAARAEIAAAPKPAGCPAR